MHSIYYSDSNEKVIIIFFLVFALVLITPYIFRMEGVINNYF